MSEKIILASSSSSRHRLLSSIGIDFTVDIPDIDETPLPQENADELVYRLSQQKANVVAKRNKNAIVIGSDQVASCEGLIMGKPITHARAVQQLKHMSGKKVTAHCGLSVYHTDKKTTITTVHHTHIVFRHLSDDQIERYLKKDSPYNCCGSLKVESLGISLLKEVKSNDPSALVGIPLIKLTSILLQHGVRVF